MYKGNFHFMFYRSGCSDTYDFLIVAEQTVTANPTFSAIKSLCFVEIIVKKICKEYSFGMDNEWNLEEILSTKELSELINASMLEKIYEINEKAKYLIEYDEDLDDDYKEAYALQVLENAYILAYWFYCSFGVCDCPFEEFKRAYNYIYESYFIEDALYEYEKVKNNSYKLINYNKMNQGKFKVQNNEVACRLGFPKDPIFMNDIFKGYALTNSQMNAIDNIDSFLNDTSERIFIMKGFGGTGKTFLTKGITDYLDINNINYILAAPTGKAAKVIQNKTNKMATTIHKAIYSFKDLYDDLNDEEIDTYKMFFNIDEQNVQPSNTIFIFDEASMIGDNYQKNEFFKFGSTKLLTDLLKFTNIMDEKFNNKIIFIGDTAQLPPVGMKTSPALDVDYFKKKLNIDVKSCELTDVVRQKKESGILISSLHLRKQMQNNNSRNPISLDLNYEDISSIYEKDLVNLYVQSCGGQINDNSIIIASKNQVVDNYNTLVREHFFPNKDFITVNDKVMAIENYRDPDCPISNGDYGYVKIVNDNFIQRDITVRTDIDNEVITVTIPLRFKEVQIEFMGINKPLIVEALIFENTLYRNKIYANTSFANDIKKFVLSESDINVIEKKALYLDVANRAIELGIKSDKKKFKKFMAEDSFFNSLKIKFGYAITCHKAQGSEWNNVFLNCSYHNKFSMDYLRWLYTAITRSSKALFLINPSVDK